MADAFEIPLKTGQPQTFITTLAGIDYRITLQWRDAVSSWILDLLLADGTQLVCGIPLITGANLLQQYPYFNIGGELWVVTDGTPAATPSFASLGMTSHLWFIVGGTLLGKYT